MTIDKQCLELLAGIKQAQRREDLKTERTLKARLSALTDPGILEAPRKDAREIYRNYDKSPAGKASRKFIKDGGFIGSLTKDIKAQGNLHRNLADLKDFKATPVGSVSDIERFRLIKKHLQRKRPRRIASEGGKARGKQKTKEAQPRHAKVKALLAKGKSPREAAEITGYGIRMVQIIKKAKLADT